MRRLSIYCVEVLLLNSQGLALIVNPSLGPIAAHRRVLLTEVVGHFSQASRLRLASRLAERPSADIASPAVSSIEDLKCTLEDEKVLNTILHDFDVLPPWTASPECSTRTFNFVLAAINEVKNVNESNLGQSAEKVLRYMLRECQKRPALRPTVVTLNTVLAAYSKNVGRHFALRKKAAEAAVKLLAEWQELFKTGILDEDVDRVSYNTVISACGKAALPDQAERLFTELQGRYKTTRDRTYQPDIISYNCLLNAFAIAGKTEKVGDLFRTMRTEGLTLTDHSYNDVLYAYSKSKQPEQAEEFLLWWLMEEQRQQLLNADERHETNFVRPETRSYNIVLHAMRQMQGTDAVSRAKQLFRIMPARDTISYTTLVAIFCSKLPGSEALDAVDRILKQAREDSSMVIDAAFISNVLYSMAGVDDKNMPVFAESFVKACLDKGVVAPNIALYNGLIHCWAKSSSQDAGERVLEILEVLEKDSRFRPDAKTYTNVLDALKTSRGFEYVTVAEDIVTRMEAVGPAPTVQTFTALIMNFARSRLTLKAVKAADVLRRMKQVGIRPNLISYNTVLNACEHTDSSDRVATEEALKVACLTFDELRSSPSSKANHVTYGSFLGTLGNLMPPDSRQEIVRLVFRRCCLEGQASKLVLKKLRSATVTEDRYRGLLEGHDENKLPASWTYNVSDRPARYESH